MRIFAIFAATLAVAAIAVCAGHPSAFSDSPPKPPLLSPTTHLPPGRVISRSLREQDPLYAKYIRLATEHAELLSKLANAGELAKAVEEMNAKVVATKEQLKAEEEKAEKRLNEIEESLRQLVTDSGPTRTRERAQRALRVLEQPDLEPHVLSPRDSDPFRAPSPPRSRDTQR